MTTFDELIGAEPEGDERARLRSVHELLVEAGPPPELTPELAAGPTLRMTLGRIRTVATTRRRYIALLAAALLIAAIAGFGLAGPGNKFTAIPLKGTVNAPNASGTLGILAATKTTQPMQIEVTGLTPGQYAIYLVHNGRSWEKCGTFTVLSTHIPRQPATINSPYLAKPGDRWVVTRVAANGHGVKVLVPATT